MLQPYSGIAVKAPKEPNIKRRFSVTADIVSFRRCARQYGTFRVHSYAPAHQTQLYFGTIIHQVLDRCHAHYKGLVDERTKGTVPDGGRTLADAEINEYFADLRDAKKARVSLPESPSELVGFFIEVENGLKSQGIYAITPDLRLRALQVLQIFNALEGPTLFPRVVDSEYRLQADNRTHIIHGVVDLLVGSDPTSTDPGDLQIWDYKGTSRSALTREDLQTYQFQMRVYAHLYELKNGVRPREAILYLMNELYQKNAPPPTKRPANAMLRVSLDPDDIDEAVTAFSQTVAQINAARDMDSWLPADPGRISENDCTICDLRWDCPTGRPATYRYP